VVAGPVEVLVPLGAWVVLVVGTLVVVVLLVVVLLVEEDVLVVAAKVVEVVAGRGSVCLRPVERAR
jgi:hypothetical protein